MYANELGQTLLVKSSTPFAEIDSVMLSLGWMRESIDAKAQPFVKDEPEYATWTRDGMKPFVIYTFNPVVKMRVMDVATVPPVLRATLANKLPIIESREISRLLESTEIKERLLALWAAQETERVDLISAVERLKTDPENVIANEAVQIANRLKRMETARVNMLAQLKVLAETAPQLIAQLNKPNFVQSLKPEHEDLEKLFDPYLAEAISPLVNAMYQNSLGIDTLYSDDVIDVWACPAGLLRWPNMLSDKFPGGYRDIAGWMNPHRIWMTWTITNPVGGTTRYDGLVWLENKWLWLPKIFRILTPFLMTDPETLSKRH